MPGKSRARQKREQELDEAARLSGIATQGRYQAGFDKLAFGYALLGATDDEIAQLLEVSPASVSRWMVEHPSFRKAVKKARVDDSVRLVKNLHRAGNGYSHRETKVFNVGGELKSIDVTKHYPPNVAAIQEILRNRQSDKWRDTKQVEHSGTVSLAALVEGLHRPEPKTIEAQAAEPAE